MVTRIYKDGLPTDAKEIRKAVFMEEQGFRNEFDEIDLEAAHIVIYNEKAFPIATCRVFKDHGHEENAYCIGRLAVLKDYRGKNIGAELIKEAEKYVFDQGGHRIYLHAQTRVSNFYQKLGFAQYGEEDEEEGCPHIWMKKEF